MREDQRKRQYEKQKIYRDKQSNLLKEKSEMYTSADGNFTLSSKDIIDKYGITHSFLSKWVSRGVIRRIRLNGKSFLYEDVIDKSKLKQYKVRTSVKPKKGSEISSEIVDLINEVTIKGNLTPIEGFRIIHHFINVFGIHNPKMSIEQEIRWMYTLLKKEVDNLNG